MSQFWVGSTITALGMVVAVVGPNLPPAAYRACTTVESKPADKVAIFTAATTRVGCAIAIVLAGACVSRGKGHQRLRPPTTLRHHPSRSAPLHCIEVLSSRVEQF